ncbi:MAG: glycosyltransferase family 2 protein [Comamonadaceae bacterium]|nr:MAG: glycosyltransferase family 2 protein [Comamonadaceae bacterium]
MLLDELLRDLARVGSQRICRVVVTLNLPGEPAPHFDADWPFVVQVRRNSRPQGFGTNHNQALASATEGCICILNPDVRLRAVDADPFSGLVAAALQPGTGCAYPIQLDEQGRIQDSERELPSPNALWRRRVLRQAEARVDWVNAACLVIATPVWQKVGGFDERYFMYCEDVDLSLRLRLLGLRLVRAPVSVIHAGQRASHRRIQHLAWHVRSLLRLWFSPVYRQARSMLPMDTSPRRTIGPS